MQTITVILSQTHPHFPHGKTRDRDTRNTCTNKTSRQTKRKMLKTDQAGEWGCGQGALATFVFYRHRNRAWRLCDPSRPSDGARGSTSGPRARSPGSCYPRPPGGKTTQQRYTHARPLAAVSQKPLAGVLSMEGCSNWLAEVSKGVFLDGDGISGKGVTSAEEAMGQSGRMEFAVLTVQVWSGGRI